MKGNILVIDDDDDVRSSLLEFLREEGFYPAGAKSANEALKLINDEVFEVAFLDLKLPDMPGTELLKKVRQIDKDLCVIVITGYPSIDSAVTTMKDNAFDYIEKPYKITRLREVLNEAILYHRTIKGQLSINIATLGKRIKELRLEQELSLSELSRKTLFSKGHLSQIENGKSSPTISCLAKIASVLGKDIVDFFQPTDLRQYKVLPESKRNELEDKETGIKYEILTRNFGKQKIEALVWNIEPEDNIVKMTHSHRGEQLCVILEGKLELRLGIKKQTLEAGDSIHFDTTIPHSWRTVPNLKTTALLINSPPSY